MRQISVLTCEPKSEVDVDAVTCGRGNALCCMGGRGNVPICVGGRGKVPCCKGGREKVPCLDGRENVPCLDGRGNFPCGADRASRRTERPSSVCGVTLLLLLLFLEGCPLELFQSAMSLLAAEWSASTELLCPCDWVCSPYAIRC